MPRRMPSLPLSSAQIMATFLMGAGVLHFVIPKPYRSMIPEQLGDPAIWVAGSGVVEFALGAALLPERTRGRAALASAALFVAVFPANIQMTVDAFTSERSSTAWKAALLARLPMQVPLVLWALHVARGARGAGGRRP